MRRAVIAGLVFAAAAAAQAQAQTQVQTPAEGPVQAQTSPQWVTEPRDWSAALAEDARALHAIVIDSHPGVHDPANPEFRGRVDAGLAEALERAKTTTDAGGYWWAMRAFAASFQDGHLGVSLKPQGGLPARWPGFLTVYRGADQVVVERDEALGAATPPPGARLIDCDGTAAEALAAQRIGAFRGRWFLESQRASLGDWQFVNASNPWISEMRACRFEVEGALRVYALDWRPIAAAELAERRTRAARRFRPETGITLLEDGGVWISTPNFDGDPRGQNHAVLTALIERMKTDQAVLRAAPYVVLDLRGNSGGSSHWSTQMAEALWGEAWLIDHPEPPIESVDWRASADNLMTIQGYFDQLTAAGESAERIGWAREIVEGMTAARAAGQPYFRDRVAAPEPRPETPSAPQRVAGAVYVLTDPVCASACLDAVDLWKAAGAIQIGRETSADTVYMDVRTADLPSGLSRLTLPMKVWRGRARGNNEPHSPARVFDGDMSDDAALRAWVRGL